MRASRTLPTGYTAAETVILKGRLLLWLNLASVLLFIVFAALFAVLAAALRPGRFDGEMHFSSLDELARFALLFGLAAILTPVVVVVVHEAIHGFGFWRSTRSRPVFGFRIWYVYASAPGWNVPRNHFLTLGLAPLIVISVVGLPLVLALPPPAAALVLYGTALNAAASVGDAYICARVARLPRAAVVEDHRDRCTFYLPATETRAESTEPAAAA